MVPGACRTSSRKFNICPVLHTGSGTSTRRRGHHIPRQHHSTPGSMMGTVGPPERPTVGRLSETAAAAPDNSVPVPACPAPQAAGSPVIRAPLLGPYPPPSPLRPRPRRAPFSVTPAQTGIPEVARRWISACAGMTRGAQGDTGAGGTRCWLSPRRFVIDGCPLAEGMTKDGRWRRRGPWPWPWIPACKGMTGTEVPPRPARSAPRAWPRKPTSADRSAQELVRAQQPPCRPWGR